MEIKHSVIIIPGLGDRIKTIAWAAKIWERSGYKPIIFSMNWLDAEEKFNVKLDRLVEVIDREVGLGHHVSLIGTSAGGSAALNAFMIRKSQIHKVVNVCGRLMVGEKAGFRAFDKVTAGYPGFAESVIICEKNLSKLSDKNKKKIMTIHPAWGDEVVPSDTTTIPGASNIMIPCLEHSLSIILSLTLFSGIISKFIINKDDN